MRYSTLILALAGTAIAAEEAYLFVPGADHGTSMGMVASKIDSDATALTWLVGCNADTGNDQCNFQRPITLTQGPKTLHYRREYFPPDNDEPYWYVSLHLVTLNGMLIHNLALLNTGAPSPPPPTSPPAPSSSTYSKPRT